MIVSKQQLLKELVKNGLKSCNFNEDNGTYTATFVGADETSVTINSSKDEIRNLARLHCRTYDELAAKVSEDALLMNFFIKYASIKYYKAYIKTT